jgi:ubiquinone biosynthesis protein
MEQDGPPVDLILRRQSVLHGDETMALSLQPAHIKRYKDIAKLFWKYGRSDLLKGSGFDDALPPEERRGEFAPKDPKAEELAKDLEEMGPIFIKLGQVLSSRSDLLPEPYVEALSRLQDNLAPFSYGEVEKIVEEELGVRISKAFAEFEVEPMGVASLGQVHRAKLRDGRDVAVKVQRPGIREQIATDFEALAELATFADNNTEAGRKYRLTEVLEEFRRNLIRELDYRLEASNLKEIGKNLEEFPSIVVPRPVDDYTTSRVLTMDYVPGRNISSLGPLAQLEMNGESLADELFKAYLKQILVDGFFHADPHPGNVFITYDHKIALIDLGMIGRLSPDMQEQLLKVLLATSEGRSEEAADIAIQIGELSGKFEEQAYRRRVADMVMQNQSATVSDIQIGKVLLDFSHMSSENGVRLPSELTMLGKALLNLDEIGRILAPGFNPNEAIRRNSSELVRRRMMQSLTPGNMLNGLMEAQDFVQHLPGRVNRILDAVAKNQLKVQVEAIDEATLVEGFQKVANRIATALIAASLIIGASMLMRVETAFRLFGYPGLAMLCFLGAAGLGLWMVISILMQDRDAKSKKP